VEVFETRIAAGATGRIGVFPAREFFRPKGRYVRMMIRKLGLVVVAIALVAAIGAGCKSVETTSAILHNQSGRYDLAIKTANEALATNPNDAEAEFQLGLAYSYLDSVGLAYKHFMRAAQIDPTRDKDAQNNIQSNFAKHYNKALNHEKDGDHVASAAEFEKAVEADPVDEKGYSQLGVVYDRLAEQSTDSLQTLDYYNRAVANFDKVLELAKPGDKVYIDALKFAGQILAKTGRSEEAAARFGRLVEEDPTNYRTIEDLGYELVDSKDWKGASLFLDLAAQARAKLGADDATLFFNLGVVNFNMGKDTRDPATLAKALEYYEKALALSPTDVATVRNAMVVHVYMENWRGAAEWGERFVALSPEDIDGWRTLTRAYNELGDSEKARRCELRYDELRKRQQP
jgi:tetratricopeptide (TPR) repeat protein